jgi:hypothetical protein
MFSSHYKHFRVTIAPLKLNLTERFLREIQMSMIQVFGNEDPLRRLDYARGNYEDNCSTWSLLEYFHAIQQPWKTLTLLTASTSAASYKRVLIDHFRMGGSNGAPMTLTFTFRPYDDYIRKAECDASLLRAGGFALPEGIPDILNPKQLGIQEVVLRSVIGESTVVSLSFCSFFLLGGRGKQKRLAKKKKKKKMLILISFSSFLLFFFSFLLFLSSTGSTKNS